MTSVSELDVYQVAYLCGGPQRVALAAVAAMAQDGRIKISRTRHRVQAVHRRAGQPVERAVLDAVPASGKVLGPLLEEVADSAAVQELIEGLRRGGLVGHHSLAGHPHLSAAGGRGAQGAGGFRRGGAWGAKGCRAGHCWYHQRRASRHLRDARPATGWRAGPRDTQDRGSAQLRRPPL